jgi:hypothetical protein
MPSWISTEPVVWIGVLDALIAVAIAFGAPITVNEKITIDGALAAIGLLVIRNNVTPNATVTATVVKLTSAPSPPVVPVPQGLNTPPVAPPIVP